MQTGIHYGIPGQGSRSFAPIDFPGACVMWLRADSRITLGGTLLATGTTPPAVTISGTAAQTPGLRVEIQTTGARGSATFRYSADNGTTWIEQNVVTAATYAAIGALAGVTFTFPSGTYTNDNVYEGTVSAWGDLSTAGNDASQATASKQPRLIRAGLNGRPTLRFASPQVLTHALGIGNPATIFGVAKTTAVDANFECIAAFDGGSGGNFLYAKNIAGTSWGMYMNAEANAGATLATFKKCIALVTAPNSIDFRTNGSNAHVTTGVSLYASGFKGIGAATAAGTLQNLTGDLAELAVYNRVLTAYECSLLEAYAASYWGV